jgi:hypothetical protein
MGDKVFDHLDLIRDPTKSAIHQYLIHMTGSKKRPIGQVNTPTPQLLAANVGQNRMPTVGAMSNQNLSAHNALQQQQPQSPQFQHQQQFQQQQFQQQQFQQQQFQSQQFQPQQFQPQQFQQQQFPQQQFQQQQQFPQQSSLSPRIPMQSAFGSQAPMSQGSPTGFGMQLQQPQSDLGGAGVSSHRMSMALGQTPAQDLASGAVPINSNRSAEDPLTGKSETEMNSRLTQIFTKIGTREETKQVCICQGVP